MLEGFRREPDAIVVRDASRSLTGREFAGMVDRYAWALAARVRALLPLPTWLAGLPRAVVEGEPPKGAGPDDLLDALACAAIARRIHAGIAKSFPQSPPRDAYGLPMAIWA